MNRILGCAWHVERAAVVSCRLATTYSEGVIAPDGCIYCVPYHDTAALCIHPADHVTISNGPEPVAVENRTDE